jgi:hypothetical protein
MRIDSEGYARSPDLDEHAQIEIQYELDAG